MGGIAFWMSPSFRSIVLQIAIQSSENRGPAAKQTLTRPPARSVTIRSRLSTGVPRSRRKVGDNMILRRSLLGIAFLSIGWAVLADYYPRSPSYGYGTPLPPQDSPGWPPLGQTAAAMPPPVATPAPGPQLGGNGLPASAESLPIRPQTPDLVPCEKCNGGTWYTRVDYFHWNERDSGVDLVNESGPLITVGYSRRVGCQRFRIEGFGGNVQYKGSLQDDDGSVEGDTLTTRYLGGRVEYEYLVEPPLWNEVTFFMGVGTRFWLRDLRDSVGDLGTQSYGYMEQWLTIYPYLGMEVKRAVTDRVELYSNMCAVGTTVVTFNHALIMDEPVWPKTGFTAQVEMGLRGQTLSLSAYYEVMTWAARRSSTINTRAP